jgi:hypothetical protein
LSLPLIAQQTPKPTPDKPVQKQAEKPNENRQRAVAVLDSLDESLKKDSNNLWARALLADTLWEVDEARARRMFADVLKAVDAYIHEENEKPKAITFIRNSGVLNYQFAIDILHLALRRDAAMAKKFMQAHGNDRDQTQLDIHYAQSLIASDPARAAAVARASFAKTEIQHFVEFLADLRQRDAATADGLFDYALSQPPQEASERFEFFASLWDYAFPEQHAERDEGKMTLTPDTTSLLDGERLKRLLDFGYALMTQRAVSRAKLGNDSLNDEAYDEYFAVQVRLREYERYAPEQAAKLRARWDEVVGALEGGARAIKETNALLGPMSETDALRQAEKAKEADERMFFYIRAADAAKTAGNWQRAFAHAEKAIAIAKQDDDDFQPFNLDSGMRAAIVMTAAERGEFDAAQRYAFDLTYFYGNDQISGERVALCARLAETLQRKRQPERALAVIKGTLPLITKLNSPLTKADALATLAETAIRLNAEIGFEVAKAAVEAANGAKYDDGRLYLFDEKRLDRIFAGLTRADFNKALLLAQSLQDRRNAALAQLAVSRAELLGSRETKR